MTKVDAIRKVMEKNGGFASWNYIYDNIEKYYPAIKSTEDWQEGIRGVLYREIKTNKNFKRISLGTFALQEYKQEKQLPEIIKGNIRMHSYIEGLIVELGNYEKFDTYCADPSNEYQENITINQITTIKDFPKFTYPDIIKIAKRIDVIWFNKEGDKFPKKIIEVVDNIGTLGESLNRMYQLKEYNTQFLILHPKEHKEKIKNRLEREPYSILKKQDRFVVINYDEVINVYNKQVELEKIKFY